MTNTCLSLLLAVQMLLCGTVHPAPAAAPASLARNAQETSSPARLWWGLIDPELSLWFAQLSPEDEDGEERILWDWSWRGFLAALFGIPAEKEAPAHAACA